MFHLSARSALLMKAPSSAKVSIPRRASLTRRIIPEISCGINHQEEMKMRKVFVFAAVSALAVFASCSKSDSFDNASALKKTVLTAIVDESPVETSLSGKDVVWTTADNISVFPSGNSYANTKFAVSEVASGGKVATFTGLAAESAAFYAAYPYNAFASVTAAGVFSGIEIPSAQSAVAGSFAEGVNPAVAYAENGTGELVFKNVGALIKFQVAEAGITSVTLSANENIAGKATVTYNAGAPTFSITDGSKAVELKGSFATGQDYYFVVYPGTYTGLKLTFTKGGDSAVLSSSFEPVVARNDLIGMGTVSVPNAKWTPDLYALWTAGGTIMIGGKPYSKASTGYNGKIVNAAKASTDLLADVNGVKDAIFLSADADCFFYLSASIQTKNVLLIGRYPAQAKPCIKITSAPFSIREGYSCYKGLRLDCTGQSGNYSFNWYSVADTELICFDGCEILNGGSKYAVMGPSSVGTCYPPHQFVMMNCDVTVNQTYNATTSGVFEFFKVGGSPKSTYLKKIVFRNNIFNVVNKAQFRLFSFSTSGFDYSATLDAEIIGNTIYNCALRDGFGMYGQLVNVTARRNIICSEGITEPNTNSKYFFRNYESASVNSVTPSGVVDVDDNIIYYPSAFKAYSNAATNLAKVSSSPIPASSVTAGTFAPVAEYAAYGAQR